MFDWKEIKIWLLILFLSGYDLGQVTLPLCFSFLISKMGVIILFVLHTSLDNCRLNEVINRNGLQPKKLKWRVVIYIYTYIYKYIRYICILHPDSPYLTSHVWMAQDWRVKKPSLILPERMERGFLLALGAESWKVHCQCLDIWTEWNTVPIEKMFGR